MKQMKNIVLIIYYVSESTVRSLSFSLLFLLVLTNTRYSLMIDIGCDVNLLYSSKQAMSLQGGPSISRTELTQTSLPPSLLVLSLIVRR